MSRRTVQRDCSTPTDHPIHVSDYRPSMYQCEDGLVRYLCPGGRVGDRRIREADDVEALADVVRAEQVARDLAAILTDPTPSSGGGLCLEDDEPDYEAILEARAEAQAEEAIERAERSYERYIYGD